MPISTLMCLWAICILPGSVHIFSCSRIGRPMVGIYESLLDKWIRKLGLRPRDSFSGNICFEFSVLCLCSAHLELQLVCPVVQYEPSLPEITFLKLLNVICLLLTFVNISKRVIDYYLRQLLKLFEPFLSKWQRLMEYRMQFLPNFTVFACGALLPLSIC